MTSENHKNNYWLDQLYDELELKSVSIGDSCWSGEKSVILPGVAIGKHVVIGASSVVTKDIPDYCVAVGNPAKIIKRLK